ncbi:putative ribonuclease H-like domain-containing protein, partial [Tanacetum coccineum]
MVMQVQKHVMMQDSPDVGFKPSREEEKKDAEEPRNKDSEVSSTEEPRVNQENDANVNSTNTINIVSLTINSAGIKDNAVDENIVYGCADDLNMPDLEDISYSENEVVFGAEADMTNLDTHILVTPILTTRIHKDHPVEQIIRDIHSAPQTRRMTKSSKKVIQALKDLSWIEVMQEELLQFKLQQMDVKSDFLYGKIKEEVYVCQPPGFEDPDFPDRRGKIDKTLFIRREKGDILLVQVSVDDIIFGSTKKKMCTKFEKMMHKKFQMSSMSELTFFLGLQVKQKENGIFISQDKYVTEILKKFGFSDVKIASTPMETHKPFLKYGEDVDEHLYRSMIGSLMYLTSSRPDI